MVGPGCAPIMASMKRLRTAGRRRTGWGKNFELKFGNGDTGAKNPKNRSNEDQFPLVVRSIHDLLSFDPQTTIVEFDSSLGGSELGHLYRIARVLEFTRFVPNYALARAMLHYICSSYDGDLHGRNLDSEARDLICSHKKKEK